MKTESEKQICFGELRNRIDRRELQKMLDNESFERITISFYRYVNLENLFELRNKLWTEWTELGVFGRTYIAKEGINAQISVPEHNVAKFREILDANSQFADVPFKIAVEDDGKSFVKLDIKIRKKIVADGLDDDAFDTTNVGEHLPAKKFNELLAEEETICIDMRNNYEAKIGHFEKAICPKAQTFRDELPEVLDILADKNPAKDKQVILYCTGGIRCEKASAYLRHHGYNKVGQLHGGIIDYKHQAEREDLPNKFRGKNFVFDNRRAESISNEVISHCDLCDNMSDEYINCAFTGCNELLISCDECQDKLEGCCSEKCRDILHLPEEEQAKLRKNKKKVKNIHSCCSLI